jgi:hydrogenase expression/formation protein HypE
MPDKDSKVEMQGAICPLPLQQKSTIVMGHGSGGKMMHELINEVFVSHFSNPVLEAGNDAGSITISSQLAAISTDAHVVKPLFFPGGDIGKLAVCGTVNDVAMLGAAPKYITVGFILEEGLEVDTLTRVVKSMKASAEEAGVQIVAGDTKVVERGKADGLYITTAGFGEILPYPTPIGGQFAQPGDKVIISGTLGDHGIAVLSARGDLGFESSVSSDIAPLNHLIHAILATSDKVHVLRDPTRGGLATSLNEIAKQSNLGIIIKEKEIPVQQGVHSACEMLGFDPLYIANEGKLIVICAPEEEEKILLAMRKTHYGEGAVTIGEVTKEPPGRVLMQTLIGSHRVVDILAGELLPRIC